MEKSIYSPPESELEPELELEITDDRVLASRWSRLWASMLDALTITPITVPLMYFTGGFDGISEGVQPSLSYTLVIALIGAIVFLVIHGKIIIRDGQTWGKKALNIKIVTMSGEHPSIQTLAKRYGFYWGVPQIPTIGQFLSIINILFIFSKSKRCIHDHVAGTRVVEANK
ncbi:MAG: RDD family protein [Pseudomonadales bacterium]|nr:RDD family protein [Pseudomonadales bacterium]